MKPDSRARLKQGQDFAWRKAPFVFKGFAVGALFAVCCQTACKTSALIDAAGIGHAGRAVTGRAERLTGLAHGVDLGALLVLISFERFGGFAGASVESLKRGGNRITAGVNRLEMGSPSKAPSSTSERKLSRWARRSAAERLTVSVSAETETFKRVFLISMLVIRCSSFLAAGLRSMLFCRMR